MDSDADVGPASWGAIWSCAVAALGISGATWLLGFWLLQYKEFRERVICPRVFRARTGGPRAKIHVPDVRLRDAMTGAGFFIRPVISVTKFCESWMVEACGLDAAVYMVRCIRLGDLYVLSCVLDVFM